GIVAAAALDDQRLRVDAAGRLDHAGIVVARSDRGVFADLLDRRLALVAELVDAGGVAGATLADGRLVVGAVLIDEGAVGEPLLQDGRLVAVAQLVHVGDDVALRAAPG